MARLRLPVVTGTLIVLLAGTLAVLTRPGLPTPESPTAPAEEADRQRLARLLHAGDDADRLRELYGEFVEEDRAEWAEACLDQILAYHPQDDWASARAGREDLRRVYLRIPVVPDLELYPDPAFERLAALRDSGIRWGTAADREYLEGLVDETTGHAVRLRGDPVYRDEWVWRTWMSRHPVFKDLRLVTEYRPPCLVFAQVPDGDEERARESLDRVAGLLSLAYEEFRRLFAERFDLPPLSEEARGELRVAKAIVFSDARSYRGYQALIGDRVAPGVEAHYVLDDQWIVLYDDGGESAEKVLFTGLQQILHLYRKICVERESGEGVQWRDPRLMSDLPWFETGFARFMATARPDGEGGMDLMAVNPELLEIREKDGEGPVLAEMLGLNQAGLRRWPGLEVDGGLLKFTARAFCFSHFLWFFEDGKYRDRLVAYLGEEIHGRSGPEVFSRVFWGDADPDWGTVEREWRLHLGRLGR